MGSSSYNTDSDDYDDYDDDDGVCLVYSFGRPFPVDDDWYIFEVGGLQSRHCLEASFYMCQRKTKSPTISPTQNPLAQEVGSTPTEAEQERLFNLETFRYIVTGIGVPLLLLFVLVALDVRKIVVLKARLKNINQTQKELKAGRQYPVESQEANEETVSL